MKILVTGATGFIGAQIVEELLKQDISVIATGLRAKALCSASWLNRVTYIQADLDDNNPNWMEYFQRPDGVIHSAWAGLPNYNQMFHLDRNLPKNFDFLTSLISSGCKNITSLGTCFEYGNQEGVMREDTPTLPNTPYAIAKDSLRKFLEEYKKHVDFQLKWIRLFYPYGIGQRENSLLGQLDTALRNHDSSFNMSKGEQLRDYVHVEDMAKAIVKIHLDSNFEGVINCCSGRPVSIRAFVENYILSKGFELDSIELNLGFYDYPAHEPMAFWGDPSKLQKVLGKHA